MQVNVFNGTNQFEFFLKSIVMKFRFCMFVIIIISFSELNAQSFKPISIGDSLPDFSIQKILRWKNKDMRSSDFNDRLLIIDFWATHCGSCIEAMPHLQSLQKHYRDKVMILPVTDQSKSHITTFMNENSYFKKVNLPSVVEDKIFHQLFPHRSIPHEIWVYKGKVIGISLGSYIDKSHIDNVLDGKPLKLPLKYDFYDFDSKEPLFKVDIAQISLKETNIYSAISGFKQCVNSDGVFAGTNIIKDTSIGKARFYFINESVFTLYRILFLKIIGEEKKLFRQLSPNSVIWEVGDRSKYRYIPELGIKYDWTISNAICYESLLIDTGKNIDLYNKIISDLNKILGLYVRWEKRREKVYVARNGNNVVSNNNFLNSEKSFVTVNELIRLWNSVEDRPYLIDETVGLEEKAINFEEADAKDISIMKAKLKFIGIQLTVEDRMIDRLVFTEVKR